MNIPHEILMQKFRDVGLSSIADNLETFLADQSRSDQTLVQTLSDLVDLEIEPRRVRQAQARLRMARVPEVKRLEDFDLSWLKGGITSRHLAELGSLSFIERKDNVMLMGESGLGKTHIALALAYKACWEGYTAYVTSCTRLMEFLKSAKYTNRLQHKLSWLRKPSLLVIDEVGYDSLSAEEANLLFQVISVRYEHSSVIITTNKPFGKWAEIMSDEAIATATLDRLLHHAIILSLKGDSYRMKDRLPTGAVGFDLSA